MKSYKRYLQFLHDFQFRAINPLQKIKPNENYRFGDVEELSPLQRHAMAELKVAAPGNVKLKLKKLHDINILFTHFDKNYPKLYEKSGAGLLTWDELEKSFPLIQNISPPGDHITPEILKTLYQSILFRQQSLLDFINRTEDILADTTHKII